MGDLKEVKVKGKEMRKALQEKALDFVEATKTDEAYENVDRSLPLTITMEEHKKLRFASNRETICLWAELKALMRGAYINGIRLENDAVTFLY